MEKRLERPDRLWLWLAVAIKSVGAITVVLLSLLGFTSDSVKFGTGLNVLWQCMLDDPAAGWTLLGHGLFDRQVQLAGPLAGYYLDNLSNSFDTSLMRIWFPLWGLGLGSYWAASLLSGMVALWGQWQLFRLACRSMPDQRVLWGLVLFCVPSVGFWANGLHKEALLMGLLCGGLALALQRGTPRRWVLHALLQAMLWGLAWTVKPYLALALLPFWLFAVGWNLPLGSHIGRNWAPAVLGFVLGLLAVSRSSYSAADAGTFALVHRHVMLEHERGAEGYPKPEGEQLNVAPAAFALKALRGLGFAGIGPPPNLWKRFSDGWLFVESILLLLAGVLLLRWAHWPGLGQRLPWGLLLGFGVLYIALIGVAVPNAGSVLRYRSPALLLGLVGWVALLQPRLWRNSAKRYSP